MIKVEDRQSCLSVFSALDSARGQARLPVFHFPQTWSGSNLAAAFQRLGHRDLVRVLEVAADRQAEREAGRAYSRRAQLLGDVEGGSLSFDVRIRGDDDLADAFRFHAFE